jgi:uncharacterized membrane protein
VGHIALLPKRLFYYTTLCGFACVCTFFAYSGRRVLASQLNSWKLLPQPERFTELYFTAPSLPTHFKRGRSEVVAFTIHNLEHQTIQYHYLLTVQTEDGKKQFLGDGTIAVAYDHAQNVRRTITVPLSARRVKVQVSLQYSGIPFGQNKANIETQSIHYWVNKAT